MMVEKHQILNSKGVICSQVDGCTDNKIKASFEDQFVSKAYCVTRHRKENYLTTQTIFLFFNLQPFLNE
jgi:hypothetical protein